MRKTILLLFAGIILLCCTMAACEETPAFFVVVDEEWSWNTGAYNSFNGFADLKEYIGQDLTVRLCTDFQDQTEKSGTNPVFSVVNGSRITMLQQSDTIQVTPDDEHPVLEFSGNVTLPGKEHIRQVTFELRISDADGNELKRLSSIVSVRDSSTGVQSGAFYIPYDINRIAILSGAAAVLVWTTAVIRSRRIRKNEKTESGTDADI